MMKINAVGIRILSALLKNEGYDVQIIFLPRINAGDLYEENVLNQILELSVSSDLIGISLMTDDFDNVVRITTKLKEKLNSPIVWGGIHPTIRPAECLNYADIVCIGEGEDTIVELAGRIKHGKDYHEIQGMWCKVNGKIIQNKTRPLIHDLDSLPFQDYDYENHYILLDGNICKIDQNIMRLCLEDYYLILTSRGCPFKCTYCWNHSFNRMFPSKKFFRKRSIDNVIEELRNIKNRFPFIKMIHIDDDAFFMRPQEEIIDFAGKYKENVKTPMWITGVTPSTVTRERLSLLTDAGMTSLRMGIQTGSERIKKIYKRNYSNQQVEDAVCKLNEFKKVLKVQYDIIIDNPWETEDDIVATLRFLSKFPALFSVCR